MQRPCVAWAMAAVLGMSAMGSALAQMQREGAFAAAFSAALGNDPDYRAARYELASRETLLPGARAGLLPIIGATLSDARVSGDRTTPNALGQELTQSLDYRSPVLQLQLRTPLFNLEAWHRYKSAGAQVEAGRMQFISRGQQLLDRLGSNWVQALFAEEHLALQSAQVEAMQAQVQGAERRFKSGEGTRTELVAAAASLSLARVQKAEAEDQREQARRAVARITGDSALMLRGLPAEPAARALPQNELQAWLDLALASNADLASRRAQLEAARAEVLRSRAGHAPRVELVASASDSRNESISTLNQKSRLYSAGVQLTIPIFSGGSVSAGVDQTIAEASRIEAQLDGDRAQLELDVRRQFQAVHTGTAKVEALHEALLASGVALEDARRNVAAGYRVPADVLEGVRRLFQARRDLMLARYDVVLARMRLQALAGTPVDDIVADIDLQLDGPAAGSLLLDIQR
ncbi:TolC family outer membrane protein [Paucibacter sp. DJ2R-2]|uniref:TolC family outer membrane protein n=1 Tax=Paucibacter sp. DJ2R-2 TaxID=2893558 RepID=UPI0021E475CE|nr:TolC family outer membrane protein [Paucibacter sp. DJ2R-2]MCV2422138.1 TolC family outer membrane protein [Paucibacter sp. DJ4R-1]MCV2440278.1 TolC family outer membrane protein [Paucibacter sp. DJ2R-2]